ncbi:MAG TPA: hypothetical protein VLT89_10570 [Usitatibacter sp.]|nr:hypothetical protein [Usitatibacter sp.]
MTIRGGCHCGNIRFEFDRAAGSPPEIAARACDCTFCTKHGGLWTSSPGGALRVKIGDPSLLSPYAFGTHTAQFQVCKRCGIVPFVTSEIEGHLYAVVSVNAFEGVDASQVTRAPASFDGEDEGARLARRKRNWIGDVRVEKGG